MAKRLAGAISALGRTPVPPNLDVKALPGRSPWRRLRVGDWRIVYRPLEERELEALSRLRGESVDAGTVIVERIVNRRELERIIAALP